MPVFKSQELLTQLKQEARGFLEDVQHLRAAADDLLNRQQAPGSWSIAQVLEHLNFYSRFYLPVLQQALNEAAPQNPSFTSGWLGHYFTKMMQPKADGVVVNKMSAPKDSKPPEQLSSGAVIQAFIKHQQELIRLLELNKDLSVRVPTSISRFIRLKAGDTYRFLLAHQQRHLAQAKRAAVAIGYEWPV